MEKKSVTGLWNSQISPKKYGVKYRDHLFEQYKLYIAQAYQYIDRRATTNNFYLTINTLVLGAIGFGIEKGPKPISGFIILIFLVSVLTICISWYITLQSYRKTISVKFQIIGEFEAQLPTRPFFGREWELLQGETNKYLPQTMIEPNVPIIFGILYITISVVVFLSY